MHFIILVPGLKDRVLLMRFVSQGLNTSGSVVIIHSALWEDKKSLFTDKLDSLTKTIDQLSAKGKVTLIGVSAGGSLVVNAFARRKDKVHRLINVSGRLRVAGWPSLSLASFGYPAFAESVKKAETILPTLTTEDKKKIMTIRPLWDGIVPLSAIPVEGATNVVLPVLFHMLATGFSYMLLRNQILRFVRD